MRRRFLTVALAVLAIGASASLSPAKAGPAGMDVPPALPQDGCQPNPLIKAPQVLKCRYGPLAVTPGQNLILVGPVSIESPRADGFITAMTPNMVDAEGEVPGIHEVHLHHGVWLGARARSGLAGVDTPFMAAGEEKTVSSTPPGYGYKVRADDEWLLNYMIHNLTAQSYSVFITYEIEWTPRDSPEGAAMKEVVPLWFDNVGGLYPVYNPTQTGPEIAGDRLDSARQVHTRTRSFSVNQDTEIVWLAGHVHPGGLRDDVRVERCDGANDATRPLLFSSEAIANTWDGVVPEQSFGSWDFRMTVTPPDWSYTVKKGDRLTVSSTYDIANPWYEAMGIVFGWGHPLAPGEQPKRPRCELPAATTGDVTNELPNPPVFGGQAEGATADPSTMAPSGAPVTQIDIAAFDYLPGGTGQAPAPVTAGSLVTFVNEDGAAMIYHSITSCELPCNRPYGQSYPKASWSFDSGQLGYGVDGATASNGGVRVPFYSYSPSPGGGTGQLFNQAGTKGLEWKYKVPDSAEKGDTYTYFCRVHPFMRGALKVV